MDIFLLCGFTELDLLTEEDLERFRLFDALGFEGLEFIGLLIVP